MRVFIDIDDTLNNFTMFNLFRHFKCINVKHSFEYSAFSGVCPGEYDIRKACGLLGGDNLPETEFWDSMPEACWSECPQSLQFDLILDAAQRLTGRDNIFLATDLTKSPSCASGKMKWIHSTCPEWLQRNWFLTPRKAQLACSSNDILIDDRDATVERWRRRGGRAILVPRPWNSLWLENTSEYLLKEFQCL